VRAGVLLLCVFVGGYVVGGWMGLAEPAFGAGGGETAGFCMYIVVGLSLRGSGDAVSIVG
jgi:hypothetical protein